MTRHKSAPDNLTVSSLVGSYIACIVSVVVMQPNCYNFRTFNNSLRNLSPPGANCNGMTRHNTMRPSEEQWSDNARNAPMTRAAITSERGSIMAESSSVIRK